MERLKRIAAIATLFAIPLLVSDVILSLKFGPNGFAMMAQDHCVPVWHDFSTGRTAFEGPRWFDITFMAILWIAIMPPPVLWIAVLSRRLMSNKSSANVIVSP